MQTVEKVLILGSAPDAVRARDLSRASFDQIVTINNAWRIRTDWDHLIHPSDFPEDRRPVFRTPAQQVHDPEDFVPAVNACGGFVYAGGTMAFTAGYWALHALRPKLIAYLGCDMVYPSAGASHFYGQGAPDPLRPDPTLQSLEAKSARLQFFAAQAGCAVVNLSDRPVSRLVAPRLPVSGLAGWTGQDSARLCKATLQPDAVGTARAARAQEEALAYSAPDGRYWEVLERYDAAALRAVDALWLASGADYMAAA